MVEPTHQAGIVNTHHALGPTQVTTTPGRGGGSSSRGGGCSSGGGGCSTRRSTPDNRGRGGSSRYRSGCSSSGGGCSSGGVGCSRYCRPRLRVPAARRYNPVGRLGGIQLPLAFVAVLVHLLLNLQHPSATQGAHTHRLTIGHPPLFEAPVTLHVALNNTCQIIIIIIIITRIMPLVRIKLGEELV